MSQDIRNHAAEPIRPEARYILDGPYGGELAGFFSQSMQQVDSRAAAERAIREQLDDARRYCDGIGSQWVLNSAADAVPNDDGTLFAADGYPLGLYTIGPRGGLRWEEA